MGRVSTLVFILALGCGKSPTVTEDRGAKKLEPKVPHSQKEKWVPEARSKTPLPPHRRAAQDQIRIRVQRQNYDRQEALTPPPVVTAALGTLIPQNIATKITGFEIHHRMKLVRVVPQRRFTRLRWITLIRGKPLRKAMIQALKNGGWTVLGTALPEVLEQAGLGRLTIALNEPAEQPTSVDVSLEGPALPHPIHNPFKFLVKEAPWAAATRKSPLLGFEFSRFHGVHFGASFTDIQRLALAYGPQDLKTFRIGVETAAKNHGYRPNAKRPHSMTTSHGASLVMTEDTEGVIVLHAQWRWGHPKAAFDKRGPKK